MQTAAEIRARAQQLRHLADSILDEQAASGLRALVKEHLSEADWMDVRDSKIKGDSFCVGE